MVAADQLGRRCIAVDIEPKWCDVTIGRMMKVREIEARLNAPDGPTYREVVSDRAAKAPTPMPKRTRKPKPEPKPEPKTVQ
jgi:hypothetical protein